MKLKTIAIAVLFAWLGCGGGLVQARPVDLRLIKAVSEHPSAQEIGRLYTLQDDVPMAKVVGYLSSTHPELDFKMLPDSRQFLVQGSRERVEELEADLGKLVEIPDAPPPRRPPPDNCLKELPDKEPSETTFRVEMRRALKLFSDMGWEELSTHTGSRRPYRVDDHT